MNAFSRQREQPEDRVPLEDVLEPRDEFLFDNWAPGGKAEEESGIDRAEFDPSPTRRRQIVPRPDSGLNNAEKANGYTSDYMDYPRIPRPAAPRPRFEGRAEAPVQERQSENFERATVKTVGTVVSIFFGAVLILLMAALLFGLLTWVRNDMLHSALLLQNIQ